MKMLMPVGSLKWYQATIGSHWCRCWILTKLNWILNIVRRLVGMIQPFFGVVISSLFSNCKMLWGHAILHTTTTYDGVCSCCSSSPFPIWLASAGSYKKTYFVVTHVLSLTLFVFCFLFFFFFFRNILMFLFGLIYIEIIKFSCKTESEIWAG